VRRSSPSGFPAGALPLAGGRRFSFQSRRTLPLRTNLDIVVRPMTFTLHAEPRTLLGKKVGTVREAGNMPAVAYGPKDKPQSLSVNAIEFKKVWQKAGASSVITLHVGSEDKDVLIHEVAIHPVSGEPLHADLYVIEKGKVLQIEVPLVFSGVSPAVKTLGGVLVKVLHEMEIEALPRSLPHEITVDIAALATFEDRITIKDLQLPEGVTALGDPDEVVALVSEPKEEVVEEVAATIADIEVVGAKGKKEEEGAAAEAETK